MKIKLPFCVFVLSRKDGREIAVPLSDLHASWPASATAAYLQRYQTGLQRSITEYGHHELLGELRLPPLQAARLAVPFEEGELHPSQPAWTTHWDFFYAAVEGGVFGLLPIFRLQGWGPELSILEKNLIQLLKNRILGISSDDRIGYVLRASWPKEIRCEYHTLELSIPPLAAKVYGMGTNDSAMNLLRNAATPVQLDRQMAFGMESCLSDLLNKIRKDKGQPSHLLIVGPDGSGKTALLLELIRCLGEAKPDASPAVWETQAGRLMRSLSQDMLGWEATLPQLLDVLDQQKAILFVHHLRDLFETGQYIGNEVSLGDALIDALPRSKFSLLAECTREELAWINIRKPGFAQLFTLFHLEDAALDFSRIALQKAQDMAAQLELSITPRAVEEALALVDRFFPYSGKPGKALRFIESVLLAEGRQPQNHRSVDADDVRAHFSTQSGLPSLILQPEEPMSLAQVQSFFNRSLFGQSPAVERVSSMLIRLKATLVRPGKPIASFLFVGPTGVGKTELAKQLARFLFGAPDRMVRFDMSEYSHHLSVIRLLASPEGQGGLLTQAIRQQPFCVLLFDEIEKAHPIFFDLLLQILGEGRLTDSNGQLTEFGSTIIIMTSNVGAEKLKHNPIGWRKENRREEIEAHFLRSARDRFRPELFNRIDDIVPFFPLQAESMRRVLTREIQGFKDRYGFQNRSVNLQISEEAQAWLLQSDRASQYGVRHIQRLLRKTLFLPLARILNQYDSEDTLYIQVDATPEAGLQFEVQADAISLEQLIGELELASLAEQAGKYRRKLLGWQNTSRWRELDQQKIQWEKERERGQVRQDETFRSLHALEGIFLRYHQLGEAIDRQEEELIGQVLSGNPTSSPEKTQMELNDWFADYLDLLLELVVFDQPQQSSCSFFIQGDALAEVTEFYDRLFEQKGFPRLYVRWWLEEGAGDKGVRPAYRRQNYEKLKSLQEALAVHDDSFVELRLKGKGCLTFCQEEEGKHVWNKKSGEKVTFRLYPVAEPQPPQDFHRKDQMEAMPLRRVWVSNSITDKKWRWLYVLSNRSYGDVLLEQLNQEFEAQLLKMF